MNDLVAMVRQHHQLLFEGNGKDSLMVQLDQLHSGQRQLKAELLRSIAESAKVQAIEADAKDKRFSRRAAIAGLVVALLMLLLTIINILGPSIRRGLGINTALSISQQADDAGQRKP